MKKLTMELCVPCAEDIKAGYSVRKTRAGVDNKITCAKCGRRRYGAEYEIEKKENDDDESE